MSTKHPDIFEALAAPFGEKEVKILPKGKGMRYITARTAMNRLDAVLGPENWWDDYAASENSVICRLTILLPDGRQLTKVDAGGYAGMSDQGDDDKSGFSDAFKRAAVKFGVARYLYNDGTPDFSDGRASTAETKRFTDRVKKYCDTANARWADKHMAIDGEIPANIKDLVNSHQLVNHTLKAMGVEFPDGGKHNDRLRAAAGLWLADEPAVKAEWKAYVAKLAAEGMAAMPKPIEPEDVSQEPPATEDAEPVLAGVTPPWEGREAGSDDDYEEGVDC